MDCAEHGAVQKGATGEVQHDVLSSGDFIAAGVMERRGQSPATPVLKAEERRPVIASGEEAPTVTIDAAYKKVRKAAKAAVQAEKAAQADQAADTDDTDQIDDTDEPDAEEQDPDDALHQIRKRAKRLRYTAAATGADEVSKQAKAIQTLLGDHQDSVVSRKHLLQQADAAYAAGEDTFTYGLLHQQEAELADSARQQLDAALRRLDKSVRKA